MALAGVFFPGGQKLPIFFLFLSEVLQLAFLIAIKIYFF
jgi:hypothetical protein